MRILLVTDFFDPYNGGVEIHVRTIADELAKRDHDVAVATLPVGPDLPGRASPVGPDLPEQGRRRAMPAGEGDRIQVFEVDHVMARIGRGFARATRPWAPPLPDPLAMVGLRRVIRSFEPDIIHGHDWLARSALPRAVSGDVPVVTSLHYYTRTCARKTLWRDGQSCVGPAPLRCLSCAADHYGARGPAIAIGNRIGAALEDRRTSRYISVSSATAAGNQLEGSTRSTVIANPLAPANPTVPSVPDVPDVPDEDPINDLPSGIPDGPFLLYVGDLRPEKGIDTLLAAVTRLRRHHGNGIPLVLVGERTTDGLHLPPSTVETGLLDHRMVQALWRRATIGVVPSRWAEPFGLVAIEAMAAGCPVVASAVGGLTEIVGDDRGVLVPPGDHVALAAAIDELCEDPGRRWTIGEAGRQSLERYDVGGIVDAIEAEYRRAIESGPAKEIHAAAKHGGAQHRSPTEHEAATP